MDNKIIKRNNVISFLSGKGGVGKTYICLSIAKIISKLINQKILIIDFDIPTHGISYFFINDITIDTNCLIDYDPSKSIIKIDDYIDFLPSTNNLKNIDSTLIEKDNDKLEANFENALGECSDKYAFVLIDCQAGASRHVRQAINSSSKCVMISEADPISVWALKNLEYEFGKIFPNETFGLINKLFLDEKSNYNAFVEFSRILKYLPPLPFDKKVRRDFYDMNFSIDLKNPSEFDIALIKVTTDLFPQYRKDFNKYLSDIQAETVDDIKNKIAEINLEIDQLEEKRKIISMKMKKTKDMIFSFFSILLAVVGVSITTYSLLKNTLNDFLSQINYLAIGGLLLLGTGQFLYLYYKGSKKNEYLLQNDYELISNNIQELKEKRDKYELMTLERKTNMLL